MHIYVLENLIDMPSKTSSDWNVTFVSMSGDRYVDTQ